MTATRSGALALALAAALGAATACGGGGGRPDYPAPGDDGSPAGAASGAASTEVAPPPRTIAPRRAVSRAELATLLDAGPGALLSHVRVEAVHDGPRFQGWRLLSLPTQPWLAAGDVVTAVNGRALERPEQLSAVFDALRAAPEIVVSVERAGFPARVRIPVVE